MTGKERSRKTFRIPGVFDKDGIFAEAGRIPASPNKASRRNYCSVKT